MHQSFVNITDYIHVQRARPRKVEQDQWQFHDLDGAFVSTLFTSCLRGTSLDVRQLIFHNKI